MKSQSRSIIAALALAAAALPLHAQEFKPTKPVEFVVHTGPGGGADVLARFIASAMEKEKLLPVRMFVVNKTGGGGQTALSYLMEKRGDAHTVAPFLSLFFVVPLMAAEAKVTMKDLTPVVRLLYEPAMVVVKNDSPYKTLNDFINAAKQNPGQRKQAAASLGGRDWMVRQLLMKNTGANWAFISFPNMGERIAALLGGHVDMIWANPSEFVPQYDAKMVRPLAVANEKRLTLLPDVPTFIDAGYKFAFDFFRGIAAPPGIPAETVAFYENMMKRMSDSSGWKEGYLKKYMLSPTWMGSKEFSPFVAKNEKIFADILKDLGLTK